MNTMALNDYNQYLEPCCMCDSKNTKIAIKEREALGPVKFKYQQFLIKCDDCGFGFVNKGLSTATLKSRDKAEMMMKLKPVSTNKILNDCDQLSNVSTEFVRKSQKTTAVSKNIYTHRISIASKKRSIVSFSSYDQMSSNLGNQAQFRNYIVGSVQNEFL